MGTKRYGNQRYDTDIKSNKRKRMDMDKSSISENIQESHCQPVDAVVRDYGSGPYVVHVPLQEASAGGADAVARISEDKALCVGSKTPSKGGGPDVIIPKVRDNCMGAGFVELLRVMRPIRLLTCLLGG